MRQASRMLRRSKAANPKCLQNKYGLNGSPRQYGC